MAENFFIVCGYGNIGRKVCKDLKQKYNSFIIVIDKNPYLREKIIKDGFLSYHGDAENIQIMLEAGIKEADAIIFTFSNDDINALSILTAKWLNSGIYVISRVNKTSSVKKIKLAGASKIVKFPQIKRPVSKLPISTFKLDLLISAMTSFEKKTHIAEIEAKNYPFLYGKQLGTIKDISDVEIIALKKIDGRILTNPSVYEDIQKNDTMVILSEKEQIEYLRARMKRHSYLNSFVRITEKLFIKKLVVYWIGMLLSFSYFVLFDNYLNWIILPAPPFTMGHLIFAMLTSLFGILLLYTSWKLDKKNRHNRKAF